MIVAVNKHNEAAWAILCTLLWPAHTQKELLSLRSQGRFANEFLYKVGDTAVAFISLSLRHDYVEGTTSSPVGYIEGIYVRPEKRGKGIAGELVAFAQKWAVQNGCTELASDTEYGNEKSRAFHKHVGFAEANVLVCFAMKLNR